MGIPDQGGGAPAGIHPIGPPAAAVLLGEVCIHTALMPTLFPLVSSAQECLLPHTPFFQAVVKVFFFFFRPPVDPSVSLTAAISSAWWEQREQLRTALSAGW